MSYFSSHFFTTCSLCHKTTNCYNQKTYTKASKPACSAPPHFALPKNKKRMIYVVGDYHWLLKSCLLRAEFSLQFFGIYGCCKNFDWRYSLNLILVRNPSQIGVMQRVVCDTICWSINQRFLTNVFGPLMKIKVALSQVMFLMETVV